MGLHVTVSFVCLFVLSNCLAISFIDEDLDSVVIEADETPIHREKRQIYIRGQDVPNFNPFVFSQIPQTWQSLANNIPLATTGPCFTSKGVLGKCTAFRQCYPYFKLPELGNFDSWVLGMYDTCSYYTPEGRQMFGVCCPSLKPEEPNSPSTTTTSTEEQPIIEDIDSEDAKKQNLTSSAKVPQFSNWPPPLPTHSPDNTIPPLPTHPPSPGYPLPTSSKPTAWPPAPSKPSYKPTKKPGTTKPAYKPTTTTSRPNYEGGSPACGAKNGYQDQKRIVGGHNAEVNEWPWIAALFNAGRQFCGGSLIDNIHILSAAHCVAHMSSWDVARLTVRLGDHNIKTNSEVRHIEKKVKRVVRHRGFDSRTLYNDIAILTLDSPIDFTNQIRALCLPSGGSRDWTGRTGTVIGWGSLRESGPQPAVLQEVSIPIWSNNDCRLKYGHAAPGGIVEHMLCAGEANRDSCSGDSGGPLMVNSGKWTQVGIVSWGIGCGKGQYPGVYTRVEKFLPWIHKNLK